MISLLFLTVIALILTCDIISFKLPYNQLKRTLSILHSEAETNNESPKKITKIPLPKPEYLVQRMDAAWGRGKFREEVWLDIPNPSNDWWDAYGPSEEEIQAAEAGYDFKDPQEWFKLQDETIDYEKLVAEAEDAKAELVKKYEDELAKKSSNFSYEEFMKAQDIYFKLQKEAFNYAFRIDDNFKQALKGQPSLDNEDTGKQYKLDKEDALEEK